MKRRKLTPAEKRRAEASSKRRSGRGRCQRCGCTDPRGCLTSAGPCYWVTPTRDLCSACVGPLLLEHGRQLDQLQTITLRLLDQAERLLGQVVGPLVSRVERIELRAAGAEVLKARPRAHGRKT